MGDKQIAARILQKSYEDLQENPSPYFSCGLIDDDLFHWRVTLIGQSDTLYSGCMLPAQLDFPDNFPNLPPTFRFLCPMCHPNINSGAKEPEKKGLVCISILHNPGVDEFNQGEARYQRWLPIYTIEAIIVSVLDMLNNPNTGSPEDIEANKFFMYRKSEWEKNVRKLAQRGIEYC